jgi:hypothetical protein
MEKSSSNSDDENYLDDNSEYIEEFDDNENYVCDNFNDDILINPLTVEFKNMLFTLEVYQKDPTDNISALKHTFENICRDNEFIIGTTLSLKQLVEEIKHKIVKCEFLYDDIQYSTFLISTDKMEYLDDATKSAIFKNGHPERISTITNNATKKFYDNHNLKYDK